MSPAMLSSTFASHAGITVGMSSAASPFSKLGPNEERWRLHIDGVRAGQSDALARLYDETSSLLFGLAVRILTDPADAEEIVVDVYQQVWRTAQGFDPSRGTVLGWLTMLTRSRAIDRLRSAGARRSRETPFDPTIDFPSAAPAPESQSIFAQERRLIRQAMETMPAEQREAIELAFFRGLTHVEVAEALGEPLGTIKTRIRMGMRKLREAFEPVSADKGDN